MLVDLIIPTYDRVDHLQSMLSSLIAQSCPEWTATVVIDNNHSDKTESLISSFNDKRIRFFYMDKRYNDWGHTPRQFGKQQSTSSYVIMTGDDNYYVPTFINELKEAIEKNNNPDIIYWDMIHSHYEYQLFRCNLAYNQIDMGAFATKREIAQSINLGTEYAADGLFVEECKKKHPNLVSVKINKVLFVHN
jgi:glycosyltransferase involved in cell wall biosynthesis